MRIGMLGTGDVARALSKGFATLHHDVKVGSRSAGNEKAAAIAKEIGGSAGTFAEAAAFGEVVVLATLGAANPEVLQAAGSERLRGKVLIDATNPLDFSGGAPRLFVGHTDSGGEQVQRLVPDARVVKAFNTVGNALMFRPVLPGGPPDMFFCGNDAAAKETVRDILVSFGWETVDLGGIESSRYLEAMCMAWVIHGLRSKSWSHAFKLLRK
jgi:predicted dinucleotide-binding enzyme